MENTKLSRLSVTELDILIKEFPWFTVARKELFLKMSLLGDECREEGLKKVSQYVFNMKVITRKRKPILKEKVEISEPTTEKSTFLFSRTINIFKPRVEVLSPKTEKVEVFEPKVEVLVPRTKKVEVLEPEAGRKIHVVGGDYFTKEDFVGLENGGLACVDRIKLNKETTKEKEYDLDMEEEDFQESKYYTETLANIYMNQGFYAKALDVYSKLILLYPKKNAYFASLIEDLKKHL